MTNLFKISLLLLAVFAGGSGMPASGQVATNQAAIKRLVAIDNVCAWPNLTLLPDGTILATIFNQPSHARAIGDVECWSSPNGEFWTKRGVAAAHEPLANRMNVGVGLNKQGELVVLASGWSLKPQADGKLALGKVLPIWSCRSKDGRVWDVNTNALPPTGKGSPHFIPFGDIFTADDGSLRGAVYGSGSVAGTGEVWMVRSEDAGSTWKLYSLIGRNHNETTLFPLLQHGWLAAARRSGADMGVDLFRSEDDGKTWLPGVKVTADKEGPANLIRLADGRLLLSCGNRNEGKYGVTVRLSSDDGSTWSPPQTLVDDLLVPDCGYPSSVQRADGTIVTAYYARLAPDHQRYHMGVILWSPPRI